MAGKKSSPARKKAGQKVYFLRQKKSFFLSPFMFSYFFCLSKEFICQRNLFTKEEKEKQVLHWKMRFSYICALCDPQIFLLQLLKFLLFPTFLTSSTAGHPVMLIQDVNMDKEKSNFPNGEGGGGAKDKLLKLKSVHGERQKSLYFLQQSSLQLRTEMGWRILCFKRNVCPKGIKVLDSATEITPKFLIPIVLFQVRPNVRTSVTPAVNVPREWVRDLPAGRVARRVLHPAAPGLGPRHLPDAPAGSPGLPVPAAPSRGLPTPTAGLRRRETVLPSELPTPTSRWCEHQ